MTTSDTPRTLAFQRSFFSGPTRSALLGFARDLERENAATLAKYHELLLAVVTKWPNESRHETALRYIQQKEVRYQRPGVERLEDARDAAEEMRKARAAMGELSEQPEDAT